jgi:MFS family permease
VSPLKVLLGLIVGQVFLHASMAGLRMAVPLQALRIGCDKLTVGVLVAAFSVAPVLLALPAGRLTDRRGYHVPLRIAVVLTALGGGCVLLSSYLPGLRYPLLGLGSLLSGAGGNVGLIAIQRTAGRSARGATELKRVFSWLGMAPSFSNFVGPAIAGILIDGAGFRTAFLALAALPLGSLACARLVPRETPGALVLAARRPTWDLLSGSSMQRLLLVNWFMSTSWDLHSFLVPVLGNERGLSASAIGSILGVFALAVTAVRFLIPVLAHRLSESVVLRSAMLLIASIFALYPFAHSPWAMGTCACVLGFALGSSQPMVMAALHHITPSERQGEALALRSMTINTSSALMPLAFGALGGVLGAAGLFWSMGALVGAGSWVARSIGSSKPEPRAS